MSGDEKKNLTNRSTDPDHDREEQKKPPATNETANKIYEIKKRKKLYPVK